MPRRDPRYSPRFRADAVRRLRDDGTTVAELSRELGVSEQTLRRWRRDHAAGGRAWGAGAPAGQGNASPTALAESPASPDPTPRQSVRLVAGVAAGTIEVGVAVVTLPAGWASRALRRYADR